MSDRTFTEHLDHLRSLADLKAGERVRVTISGRTGTIVKKVSKHNGWLIKWDEPMFGVEEGTVRTANLERLQKEEA